MEWADNLIIQAKKLNIPVFVKENYKYKDRLKAFPEILKFVRRCIKPEKIEGTILPKDSKRTRIISNYAEELANGI